MIDAEIHGDELLLSIAIERRAHYDPSTLISEEKMLAELDISEENLRDSENVDID